MNPVYSILNDMLENLQQKFMKGFIKLFFSFCQLGYIVIISLI